MKKLCRSFFRNLVVLGSNNISTDVYILDLQIFVYFACSLATLPSPYMHQRRRASHSN